jgi:hypothetical protein
MNGYTIGKRVLTALLALVMAAGMLPALALEETDVPVRETSSPGSGASSGEGDVWEAIDRFEEETFAAMPRLMGDEAPAEEDYAAISEQVEAFVRAREDFVEGSLHRNGDFFYWRTADGELNGYSPYERKMAQGEQLTEDVSEAYVDGETVTGSQVVELMSETATSRDIAVINPWKGFYVADTGEEEFFDDSPYTLAQATAVDTGGRAYHLVGLDATIDAIGQAFSNCGVVFVYTHGNTDYGYQPYSVGHIENSQTEFANCSYITIRSEEGITDLDRSEGEGEFGSYPHCFKSARHRLCVDGFVIRNHMPKPAPNSLAYFYSCLLMSTDKTIGPLLEYGVHTAVGFTQPVYTAYADAHSRYFFDALRSGSNAGDAFNYVTRCYGNGWDLTNPNSLVMSHFQKEAEWFTLDWALEHHYAFPLLVSPQEPYPGHGNVDKASHPVSDWTLPLERSRNEAGEYIRRFVFEQGSLSNDVVCSTWDYTSAWTYFSQGPRDAIKYFKVSREDNAYRLYANLKDNPGFVSKGSDPHPINHFDGLWEAKRSDGSKDSYRFDILLLEADRKVAELEQSTAIPFGRTFDEHNGIVLRTDAGEDVDVFSVERVSGAEPEGMALVYDGKNAPVLIGTPKRPRQYDTVYHMILTDGSEVELTLTLNVTPVRETTTSQNITILADGTRKDCAIHCGAFQQPVVEVENIDGEIPGMFLSWTMDQPPVLTGIPSQSGTYDVSFRIYLKNGVVCTHTIHVTVIGGAEPIEMYSIDCSLNPVTLSDEAHFGHVMPSLRAAAQVGQIAMEEDREANGEIGSPVGTTGLWTVVDLDKNGSWDMAIEHLVDGYTYSVLRTTSLRNNFMLRLNDEALALLGKGAGSADWAPDGSTTAAAPYAKTILFATYREWLVYVDGVKVTSLNRKNVLGDGKVSFDGVRTLSVKSSCESRLAKDRPLIESEIPLTIRIGKSDSTVVTLTSDEPVIAAKRDLVIQNTSLVVIRSNKSDAIVVGDTRGSAELYLNGGESLSVEGVHAVRGVSGRETLYLSSGDYRLTGEQEAVTNLSSVTLDHCSVEKPLNTVVSDNFYLDGSPVNEVQIKPFNVRYGLTVTGVPVTDRNAGNILGDRVFRFDAASNTLYIDRSSEYHTEMPLVESAIDGLTVRCSDAATLANDGDLFRLGGRTTFTGGELTLRSGGTAVGMTGNGQLQFKNVTLDVTAPRCFSGGGKRTTLYFDEGANVSLHAAEAAASGFASIVKYELTTRIEEPADADVSSGAICTGSGAVAKEVRVVSYRLYDLTVNGVYVAEDIRDDILGDGVFSFDGNHTLTISGDLNSSSEFVLFNKIDGLQVVIAKDCTISGSFYKFLFSDGDVTFTGPGKLTIDAPDCQTALDIAYGHTLTLSDVDLTVRAQFGVRGGYGDGVVFDHCRVSLVTAISAVDSLQRIEFKDCLVTEPESYQIKNGAIRVSGSDEYVTTLLIEPNGTYPLYIAGTQVDERNCADILGDGVFSFDGDRTLSVRGVCTTEDVHVIQSAVRNLIIDFKPGSKLITTGVGDCVHLLDDARLTGGPVTLDASEGWAGFAIATEGRTTVTLDELTMDAVAYWGTIAGSGYAAPASLVVRRSSVDVTTTGDFYAIPYFTGSITLEDAVIDEPWNGRFTMISEQWYPETEDGKMATHVVIRPVEESIEVTPEGDSGTVDYDVELPRSGRGARMLVARYDGEGRFLGVEIATVTQNGRTEGSVTVDGADEYRVFFIGEDDIPIHESWSSEDR